MANHHTRNNEIVISGISGRFPNSNNVQEFAENLYNKRDMIKETSDVWHANHPEIPHRIGEIHHTDKFDAGYFGVHHRQANIMDPTMRKVLETAVEAIIDAGVNPSELEGSKTGVFLGLCFSELEIETLRNVTKPQSFAVSGYFRSFVAHRISYYLKLKGPSCVADTACSSSSHALEMAYRFIRDGKCESAIVGGAHIVEHPAVTLQFYRLGVLSDDGKCKVFDQDANGYVRSGSIVCTFIQKLKNARRNYGEIIYSKVNCDGYKEHGITYPSSQAQQQLLTDILNESKIHPDQISFLEAHGTGTKVGDPEEVEAIDNAIAKKRSKQLSIGSVKCSIGHTEPASGLCSLVKVVLAMESGYISPNIYLKKIKKGLVSFEEGRLKAVTETTKLEGENAIVAINNFGFGGTNAQVLVRRFDKTKKLESLHTDVPTLVCVSGRTEESVRILLNDINEKIDDVEYIGLMHQVFKFNFDKHLYRGFTIITRNRPTFTSTKLYNQKLRDLCVVLGNIKNNYCTIAQHLLGFPYFKSIIEKIQVLSTKHGIDIFEAISNNGVKKESYVFGIFAVNVGIVELLKLIDLKVKIMYDNPIGKIVSVLYQEEITLETALMKISEISYMSDIKTLTKKERWQKKINRYFEQTMDDTNISQNIIKSAKVLLVSDQVPTTNNCFFLKNNFLDIVGKLYQSGFNPQVYKLYPQVQFPVARNTPMLSPLLKWNYKNTWYTYKFDGFKKKETLQHQYNLSYTMYKEQEYIKGHVVNERNLIPATEYLYLVWQTIARSEHLLPEDVPVVFENCRFIKAITMPKADLVQLIVSIHRGSGDFEIVEKDSVVVTGNVIRLEDSEKYFADLPPLAKLKEEPKEILEHDEIYRELYLRGYSYSGLFKGIVKCNVDASAGLLQWEQNWTAFIDKMLQMSILQTDTKLLYVPVSIKKLTIDPQAHLSFVDNQKDLICPAYYYKDCYTIRSGGIEISGLQAASISRKKPISEPILEKYVFVPNVLQTSLEKSVRINTQIIIENTMEANLKAVEIFDEFSQSNSVFILPLVNKAASDLPLITTDLTISTQSTLEDITDITIMNFAFTPGSNLSLVVGTNLLKREKVLEKVLISLKDNGFILTREDKNFVCETLEHLVICTEHITVTEKLILLRKKSLLPIREFVEVSSNHFDWLPQVQKILKCEQDVVIYTKNQLEGIMGFVNCLRRETGGNKVQCLYLCDSAPNFDLQNSFYQNQLKKKLAINIYKNGKWGTYRHLLLDNLKEIVSPHCYINATVKGDLSSLKWLEGPLHDNSKLENDNILIYPYYAAINFRDVMTASGRVNVDAITTDRKEQENLQGIEFCGRDVNGRRVMGMVSSGGALTTIVNVNKSFLWEVPNHWSLEEASTVVAVYSTVVYALLWVIKIKPGMSVLIHSATGGIGLAALNVCLYHGCQIFVTVGTQKKRDYLNKYFPQIIDSHIGNSRDTSFETMIRTKTEGRGVDVVLNSLSEEKLLASIRCLAQGGDFLEIGKFDLGNNASLNMLLMEKDIHYHGVMLDRVIKQSSLHNKWIMNKVYEGINAGYVKPLPRKVFNYDEVEAAFRYMTTGNHIGKVVVKVRDENENSKLSKGTPRFNCHTEKSYIIIGGLGGFGLELADWLFLRGAKNLVLVSRSGVQSGYQTRKISNWTSHGVKIKVSTQDTTIKKGCINLIKEASQLGPIDGVFNLAVVLKDALFENQTEDNFCISLAPKAKATSYLDQVTREYCSDLRYFVVFSSVSCGRGNIGQTNYGMANSIMERVCENRKRDGFPATAIQWGAIGDVGLVAKMQKENKELVIGGTLQQKISSCLGVIDILLKQDSAVVSSMVVAEKNKGTGSESAVIAIAHILGINDLKTISPHITLAELGMDSMTATEIIQLLEKDYEIYITPKEIRSLTFAKLLEMEAERCFEEDKANKIKVGTMFLIQHIPKGTSNNLPVVRLSGKTDKQPNIFVLPGIEGVFHPFDFISKNVGANLLGLQYNYYKPENSIEEIAKTTLPHIESKLAESSPFILVGYSFGTLVGLEIVSLLEEKGYEGKFVAVDGSVSYIKSAVQEMFPFENDVELQSWLMYKIMLMLLPVAVVEEQKKKLFKCENLDRMVEFLLSLIPEDAKNREKLEKQAAFTLFKRIKSVINYKFDKKIKSKVYLIKANNPIVSVIENDYDLTKNCEKPVEVSTVDGDHVSILKHPDIINVINQVI